MIFDIFDVTSSSLSLLNSMSTSFSEIDYMILFAAQSITISTSPLKT